MMYRFLILLLLSLISSSIAFGRWAVREDADTEIEFFNREIDVRTDGTYTETLELQTKILKEGGRNSLATHPLVYNASGSDLKIVKAMSIQNGQEFVLDSKLIEDKPMASTSGGFDQYHQVMLAFPHSEVNSELYLKYRSELKEPAITGFFSTDFVYGREGYWNKSTVRITSALPLFLESNDPEHFLDIQQSSQDGKYLIEIRLKKPLIKQILDEPAIQLNPKHLPWVTVSTLKNWSDLGKKMTPNYEEVVNQPLPPLFQSIVEQASKKQKTIDRINTVTSLLAENIKYMGDWRSVAGKFIPRNLERIAETRLGDCKDFSASTTAILRKLGIKAHIAAVQRGEGIYSSPTELPNMDNFNHVLVQVKEGDRILWVDPTNFASYAQGIFPDIEDRWALVFDPTKPSRERIPTAPPQESQWHISQALDLKTKNQMFARGQLQLKGSASLWLTGAGLRASSDSIRYGIIRYVGNENKITDWKVETPELTSRVVDDLAFNFQYHELGTELKTNIGPAFAIQPGYLISTLMAKVRDRVSDLYVGSPAIVRKRISLRNISPVTKQAVRCQIQSPWLDAKREITNAKQGIEIADSVTLKKAWIHNDEMKTPAFLKMQDQLDDCFNGSAVVFNRGTEKKLR